jgi:hypothetical protein
MDLSPETRKDYTKYSAKVLPVFGKTDPNKINLSISGAIWISVAYPAELRRTGKRVSFRGYSVGAMSVVMWRESMSGVKQFKEVSRERYITDEEYKAVYEVGADVVRATMEIAYLCWPGKAMSCL